MRNPFPAFQWYPRDWQASRARALMSFEQQAAYRNLLDHAWDGDPACSLPDDDEELAALSGLGAKWAENAPMIRRWFVLKDGRLWNTKLLGIFREMRALRAARARAGQEGGRKRAENQAKQVKQSLSDAQATASKGSSKFNPSSASSSASASSGEEEEKNEREYAREPLLVARVETWFAEAFWPAYPRKVAKEAARRAVVKLAPDEPLRTVILAAVAKHAQTEQWRRDGGQYIPHPATWINQRRWLDEIPEGHSNGGLGAARQPSAAAADRWQRERERAAAAERRLGLDRGPAGDGSVPEVPQGAGGVRVPSGAPIPQAAHAGGSAREA